MVLNAPSFEPPRFLRRHAPHLFIAARVSGCVAVVRDSGPEQMAYSAPSTTLDLRRLGHEIRTVGLTGFRWIGLAEGDVRCVDHEGRCGENLSLEWSLGKAYL